MRRMKAVSPLGLGFTYVFLLSVVAAVVFPILWILACSFRSGSSLYSPTLIPRQVTVENYVNLFTNPRFPFPHWAWNSLKVCGASALGAVVITAFTGYAFSRFRFPGRRSGLMGLLVLQMFPGSMAMVAIYVLLNALNLLDTHLGLILVYTGGAIPFSMWLAKGYIDAIPRSLDEAALIDGANTWQVFWQIVMPLARPILAVIALLNFIGPFNDYLLARIVLTSDVNKTLAVGLRDFVTGQYDKNWTQFAAGSLLTSIPIMVLFLLLQKHFISGLVKGATKG